MTNEVCNNNVLVILVEKYNFKIKKFPGTKNATYIALKQRLFYSKHIVNLSNVNQRL